MAVIRGVLAGVVCLALGAGCARSGGLVEISLSFADAPPADARGLWLHAFVEDAGGRILASDAKELAPAGELALVLGGVVHGDGRAAIVEVRDGPDRRASAVLYHGRSPPFSLRPGSAGALLSIALVRIRSPARMDSAPCTSRRWM